MLLMRRCSWPKGLNISVISETLRLRVIKLPSVLARSLFTTYNCSTFYHDKSTRKPLKQWALDIKPFGTVKVRVPCEVTIRPLDPHQLDTERAFVTIFGDTICDQTIHFNNIEVKYDDVHKQLLVFSDKIDSNTSVAITAPVKFDLDIKTTGTGNVNIKDMENESCIVETEYGSAILNSLKSQCVHVKTKGGNIIGLGTIYGNTEIQSSSKSSVTINKLQGSTVSICTEDGLLKTKYLYAESSRLSTASGNVELGSIHGDVAVKTIEGNIIIDSLDGYLKALTTHGDIDVYISQLGRAALKSLNGSVTVKVPTSLQAYLKLSGVKVDIDQQIHLKNVNEMCKDKYRIVTDQAAIV
ncbi:protein FAM185A isoform X2 [Protopterus annectens]|uniref:protein FAM185A isoform X2 n=1 Tax=Protopterus annectens TaxID=7888 RepID=UPI001CFB97D9|nr:protein FAM185A isoform X2 [Protopterus annectens]